MFDILPIILVISLLYYFIGQCFYFPGTDHKPHLNIIQQIKKQGNRFIRKQENILGSESLTYPQFFHLILSYFNLYYIAKNYKVINPILYALSLIIVLIFVNNNEEKFLLFYFLIPFNYSEWNAKNTGLSVRAFGALLTTLFLINYLFNQGDFYLFYGIGTLLTLIIILSSQFAYQFILFFALFSAVLFQQFTVLVFVALANVGFFLFFYRYAVRFYKGQLNHKTIFYKYLLPAHVFAGRKSMWLDFLEFPNKIKVNYKTAFFYILSNPVVFTLINVGVFILIFWQNFEAIKTWNYNYVVLTVSTLAMFIFTSIGKLRFLGEPERYIEIIVPFLILLFVKYNTSNELLILLIVLHAIVSSLLIYYANFRKKNILEPRQKKINDLKQTIFDNLSAQKDPVIITNGWQLGRMLFDDRYKIVSWEPTQYDIKGLSLKELFPDSFLFFSLESTLKLAKIYNCQLIILDRNYLKPEEHERLIKLVDDGRVQKLEEHYSYSILNIF